MGQEHDDDVISASEYSVALAELTALGLVEWKDDELLRLTEEGLDRAWDLRGTLGNTDFVLLALLFRRLLFLHYGLQEGGLK